MSSVRRPFRYVSLFIIGAMTLFYFNNCGSAFVDLSGDFGPARNMYGLASDSPMEQKALGVLAAKCANCHSPTISNGGVPDVMDVRLLVQTGFIIPGAPNSSRIMLAIEQNRMPPNSPLNANDRLTIREWILGNTSGNILPAGTTATVSPVGTLPTGSNSTVVPTVPGASPSSFRSLQASIFQPRCVSCHNGQIRSGGYAFDSYASALQAVTPGNPNTSRVYTSTSSGRMPTAGQTLNTTELANLAKWIRDGALND